VIAACCFLVIGLVLTSIAANAEPASESDADRIEELERRVGELEQAEGEPREAGDTAMLAGLPEWAQRVRLGGYASVGYFRRGDLTPDDSHAFEVWDTRLFVDAELAQDVAIGAQPIVRNIGMTFEWDLVRLGSLQNDVGELYVDFQDLLGSSWLSAQVGRFQIPVGESYLRYSRGMRDDPFITQTVGGPWFWDEGIKIYGKDPSGHVGYVASISNGDTDFNVDSDTDPQGTLKLYTDPWPWLHLSVSALGQGDVGSRTREADGALWLGETWAMAIGGSPVPNFIDGVPLPDGPATIDNTWLAGADAIVRPLDGLSVWLGAGRYHIEADGSGPYDRDLEYWIAEIVAEGKLVSPSLEPLYLALRADGITTGDSGRGYLLDSRQYGSLGFNMRDLNELAAVLGVRIGRYVRLRTQYAYHDVDLVRGVTPDLRRFGDDEHWFAADVAVSF
jgi:hypothetical protein